MPRTAKSNNDGAISTLARVSKLYEQGRLLPDGYPSPVCVARNRAEYGYTCPRAEFIAAPEVPSAAFLSRKWNVSIESIEKWAVEQDWPAARVREWMRVEELASDSSAERIAQVRVKEQDRQRDVMLIMREVILEKVQDGKVVETTATGVPYERPHTIKEMKDAAQAIALCNEAINNSLGIAKNLGKIDESKIEDKGSKVARRVIHKHTVETHEVIAEEDLALPANDPAADLAPLRAPLALE